MFILNLTAVLGYTESLLDLQFPWTIVVPILDFQFPWIIVVPIYFRLPDSFSLQVSSAQQYQTRMLRSMALMAQGWSAPITSEINLLLLMSYANLSERCLWGTLDPAVLNYTLAVFDTGPCWTAQERRCLWRSVGLPSPHSVTAGVTEEKLL